MRKDPLPVSPTTAKRVAALLIIYGLLVIAGALYYYVISGDRSFPLPYLFQVTVIGVCVWGLRSRRRWALVVAGVFAAWQVYYGVSSVIMFLNAGGWNGPGPARIIMGLLELRTVPLIVLLLLLFLAGRE